MFELITYYAYAAAVFMTALVFAILVFVRGSRKEILAIIASGVACLSLAFIAFTFLGVVKGCQEQSKRLNTKFCIVKVNEYSILKLAELTDESLWHEGEVPSDN